MSTENDSNLEEQYKNMVQSVENQEVNEEVIPPTPVQEAPLNLGKVNMERFTGEKAEDADFHLGYHSIPLLSLPSGGMFYPEGTQLSIRSAKVAEVRHFSTIDETNVLDIDEKLNTIVDSCTRITCTSKRLSYKDLLEEDRFYIILSIRDLTFPEPESSLKIEHMSKKGEKHDIEIKKDYFQYFKIPTELDKYYDSGSKSFLVETRSFGIIEMKPPVIGVMQKITAYIREKQQKGLKVDQSVLQIIPYLHKDWRTFNDKTIFEFEIELNGWTNKKYNLVYTLAEKMKVGIQPNMLVQLGDEEEEVPISFRDGIKSLFIVQDIAGELL
jgi:hypothetical protein